MRPCWHLSGRGSTRSSLLPGVSLEGAARSAERFLFEEQVPARSCSPRSAFVLQAIADLAYGTPVRPSPLDAAQLAGVRCLSNLGSVRTWPVFPTR
jgi:hypothetical protein